MVCCDGMSEGSITASGDKASVEEVVLRGGGTLERMKEKVSSDVPVDMRYRLLACWRGGRALVEDEALLEYVSEPVAMSYRDGGPLGWEEYSVDVRCLGRGRLVPSFRELQFSLSSRVAPREGRRLWPCCWPGRTCPKPPVELAILIVALAVRSKASRHASAGGHFSMRSVRTEVAAKMVKSTSSIVCLTLAMISPSAYVADLPNGFSLSESAILRKDTISPP